MVKQGKESINKSPTRIVASGTVKKRATPGPKVQLHVLPPQPCKSFFTSGSSSPAATPTSKCKDISEGAPLPSQTPASATSLTINNIEGNVRTSGDSSLQDEEIDEYFLRPANQRRRSKKSKLDKYLDEYPEEYSIEFDLLLWWKANAIRYPILAKVARDVFAIQCSTVASESAFSIGGRTFDKFRSSLNPITVEILICSQDWLKNSPIPVQIEEDFKDMESLESEITTDLEFVHVLPKTSVEI